MYIILIFIVIFLSACELTSEPNFTNNQAVKNFKNEDVIDKHTILIKKDILQIQEKNASKIKKKQINIIEDQIKFEPIDKDINYINTKIGFPKLIISEKNSKVYLYSNNSCRIHLFFYKIKGKYKVKHFDHEPKNKINKIECINSLTN